MEGYNEEKRKKLIKLRTEKTMVTLKQKSKIDNINQAKI